MKLKSTLFGFSILALSVACNQKSANNQEESEQAEPQQEQVDVQQQNAQPQTSPIERKSSEQVSDEDLMAFAEVNQRVQVINQQAQQEMMAVVQKNGLDVNRYSELAQAAQNPQAQSNATAEEKKKFAAISTEIQGMQKEFQGKIDELLVEQNISEQKMQELAMKIQSDSILMERYTVLQQAKNPTN